MNMRFPGQYYDGESGLHYNYFRTYDPELGRYITSDPIGLFGGVNTFVYVLSDPVMMIDPKGLDPVGLIRERCRAKKIDPRYDVKEFVDSNGFSHNADDLIKRQKELINGPARDAVEEGADTVYWPSLNKLKKIFGLDKPKNDPGFPKSKENCWR
jgi:RHS repeat-associated protein